MNPMIHPKIKKFFSNFKNPSITKFNSSSHFIYDFNTSIVYLSKIKDKNRNKLTNTELTFLESYVSKKTIEYEITKDNTFIQINKNLADDLFNFYKKATITKNHYKFFY